MNFIVSLTAYNVIEKSLTIQRRDAAAESQGSQEENWFRHHLGGCFDLSAPMGM